MYCKHCMRMLPDGTIICPNCGKPQKKGKNKKIIILFAIILSVVALVAGFLVSSKKKKYDIPLDTVAQGVKNFMTQSGFECSVSYDETAINVDAIYPDLAFFANEALDNGGEDMQGWNDLVDALVELTEGIEEYIDIWYEDIPFSVFIFNDQNPDNLLIMIVDGELVYDVVNSAG